MADLFIREFTATIRQSPMRAAVAIVLLITTTVYVCTGQDSYRVADIGQVTPSASMEEVTDLISRDENIDWEQEIDRVSTSEDDAPAITKRVAGRDQYIDARLTHAVSEEDAATTANQTRVIAVSAELERRPAVDSPVWLLGVLSDESLE